MAGFKNVGAWADCYEQGRMSYMNFNKTTLGTTSATQWVDGTISSGYPRANFYASSPLEAAHMDETRGIYHGPDVAPAKKYISNFNYCFAGVNARSVEGKVLDFLMYYPFIDGTDTSGAQNMVQTVSLPRFTDGEGVRAMLVTQASGDLVVGSFRYDYINQDGDLKTSPDITMGVTNNIYAIIDGIINVTAQGPFLPLADGDTGIRSIVSYTQISAKGGLYCLVLVKPILNFVCGAGFETNEINVIAQNSCLPKVEDGAFLGFIFRGPLSLNGAPMVGYMNFIWSET